MKNIILFTLAFILSGSAFAEKFPGGGIIVPIKDDIPQRPFNLKTDVASIYLEKAILYKENGWFTDEKSVAIVGKVIINAIKFKDRTASSLEISRIYKFDVSIYEDGRVEIPLKSLPLLDNFKISGKDYVVTSMVMDLSLSKQKEKSGFSKVIEKLIEVSGDIPIPGNPYAEYAKVFGDTFGEVLNEAVKTETDSTPFARFGVRFLAGDSASLYTEKPGLHAIILGSEKKESDFINIEDVKASELSFDSVRGLQRSGEKVKNNHLIIRVVSSLDSIEALLAKNEVINQIAPQLAANAALASRYGLENEEIKSLLKIQSKNGLEALKEIDDIKFQKAIKEINAIGNIGIKW